MNKIFYKFGYSVTLRKEVVRYEEALELARAWNEFECLIEAICSLEEWRLSVKSKECAVYYVESLKSIIIPEPREFCKGVK